MSRADFNSNSVLTAACAAGTLGVLIFAILPFFLGLFASSLSLSDQQMGFLGSAYVGGYTFISALSFLWITRINWRHAFTLGVALLVAGLVLAYILPNYSCLLASLAISGAGAGFMHSLSAALVSEMDDADRKFGIKMIPEQAISALLLFLVPAFLIERWGLNGLILSLIIVFLFALVFLKSVPDGGNKQLSAQVTSTQVKPAYVFLALFGLLAFFGGTAGVWAFTERIATDSGLEQRTASQILALGVISSAIGPIIPAILGDKFGRLLPLSLCTAILIACLYVLSGDITAWSFAISLFFLPMVWYAGMAYQMGIIANADTSGRFSVLMTAALGLGATIGPALVGTIKSDYGLANALTVTAIIALVGTVCSIVVARHLKSI